MSLSLSLSLSVSICLSVSLSLSLSLSVSVSVGSVELDCEPFLHCKISNFVQNQSFVQGLQEELLQLNFNSKSNDLYKFLQVL
uniref:Secreted protein n=1 Tax=Astyanax mexicanus TaxID=7994 RepID=A0A8B9I0A2_ASTMX